MTFFLECWKLWGEKEDLKTAVHITEKFYEQDGFRFYPIEMPIVMLCHELEKAGEQKDLKTVKAVSYTHLWVIMNAYGMLYTGLPYYMTPLNWEQGGLASSL